ncbi:DUF2852 domain-containing protein [Prosthecomicrobium sp. N25]|uniref:DUF2852 domain-containing protein n=1 Tax=Prosthecomicrobium sp. N25 TaxID=3129254 RepID=UPI0030772CF9
MHCNIATRPGFTPLTIGLMVLGFMIAWPLGLAMLAYIFWGHRFRGFYEGLRSGVERAGFTMPGAWNGPQRARPFAYRTGNSAFDEYRRREMERLDEERRRLDEERREFEAYVRDLQRAKDQEEFDRFMAERRRRSDGPATA